MKSTKETKSVQTPFYALTKGSDVFVGVNWMFKNVFALALILSISVVCAFAETKGSIPSWIKNSVIVMSEHVYGENKTIEDLFGRKPLETTNTTITTTDKKLIIENEAVAEGVVILKIEVTFIMNKIMDAGTCYPSKLVFESPMTFQTQTLTCYGPYNDPENYGRILGFLSESMKLFYEQ